MQGHKTHKTGPTKRALDARADEIENAFSEAKIRTGLHGDTLFDRLRQFRAGAFYPEGHQPRHGLTSNKEPIDVYEYMALRDLDRVLPTAQAVRAANKILHKARAVRVSNQKQRAGFDRAEWCAMAFKSWCDDITLNRSAVAATILDKLAKQHPGASAKDLPSVRTIEDHIKGVKAIARKRKAGVLSKASQS